METKKTQEIINFISAEGLTAKVVRDSIDQSIFHANIFKDGGSKGFGSDEDSEVALTKAFAEYTERRAFSLTSVDHGVHTSSGYAANLNDAKASLAARLELIERDAFLCSWFTQTPPYWMTESELALANLDCLNQKRALFAAKGFGLNFGVVGFTGDCCVVVGMLKSLTEEFGFAIDTAASLTLADACMKVYRSLCYIASFLSKRKVRGVELFDPSITTLNSVSDHFEYFLNPENFPSWFKNSADSVKFFPEVLITSEIVFRCQKLSFSVAFAKSSQHQPYFAGESRENTLNLQRIQSVFPDRKIFPMSKHPLA